MSSRQMLSSDTYVNFPLENSHFKPNAALDASSSSIPSIYDVLPQGCSVLSENRKEGVGGFPLFRTELEKTVSVNQSSFSQASYVLDEDAYAGAGKENTLDNGCQYIVGKEHATDDNYDFSNSLFRTGTGKRVNISANGLLRAMELLGLEEDALDCDSQGLQQTAKLCAIDDTNELQHSAQAQLVGGTCTMKNDSNIIPVQSERYSFSSKELSLKSSDRSISISNDALQRARSLPGDPDLGCFFHEGNAGNSIFSFMEERQSESSSICEGNDPQTPFVRHVTAKSKYMTKSLTAPIQSSDHMECSTKYPIIGTGNNLIAKFNAAGKEVDCLQSRINCRQRSLNDNNQVLDTTLSTPLNGFSSRIDPPIMSSSQTSVDMSNSMFTSHANCKQPTGLKRRLGSLVTVSPSKKPRSCKFSAPLNEDVGVFPTGFSKLSSDNYSCKRKVSTRYPFKRPRMHIGEFFGMPLSEQKMLEHFPDHLRQVTSGNAENYVFHDGSGVSGPEAFFHKLAQNGASSDYATKEWIMNHYKWIVWKLACYERCYPGRSAGKFLTTPNVLEELKYRYEREVNHGHRPVIKKILEGGASYSSMMILCISAIYPYQSMEIKVSSKAKHRSESSVEIKVELTDGWYSIIAILDAPLSKKLAAGKLFVGQKLRIWGAGLSGWTEPVSPLEVPTSVCLLLHMNGTHRAHWAEKLGLCEHAGPPIAFRCIKVNGGLIPQTLARITRIYPILYMLNDGKTVLRLRSEMMETNMMQLDDQRCTAVMEGITSNLQEETLHIYDDGSKGAQIYNMPDTAADPEYPMADTSHEQLSSFVAYKEKIRVIRQSNTEKSNDTALKDPGLGKRDAIPFMRVRVVGLTQKDREDMPREGLVTIWNPTEKQRQELVEGQAYLVTCLTPSSFGSDVLHLKATGSSTKWSPLSSGAREQFKPFFNCRKPISISSLIDIPLSSEFDTAAYIVHVGDVYTSGHQKTQRVFVVDGSMSSVKFGQITSLLAICFCSQSTDNDLIPPFSYNLVGSTVGFCNLTKKEKDHINHIWIAEATENSTYHLSFDSLHCSHLMHNATSIKRWAINSSLTIGKVKEKILAAVANCKTE